MKHIFNLISFLIVIGIFPSEVCSAQKKPNVILITIDALRADHLHCYGYERETSPTLDRLAGEGVLFENAYTVATRTIQSMAAMLTGRYPQTLGVRVMHGKLKASELTLAEVLKQQGYKTGAVCKNEAMKNSNLHQGFDFIKFIPRGGIAKDNNIQLLSWLKQNPSRPVFAWVHYLDPHMPYIPHKKLANSFDPGYRGMLKKGLYVSRRLPDVKMGRAKFFKPNIIYNHTKLPERELKWVRALYDGEIAYTDMYVGKLLEQMKSLGILDNALIIISSDHGESLGEHQYYFSHGDFVYEATLKVPLILHWPGKIPPGRRISQKVRTIDILPTVLSLLGISDPSKKREGVDLKAVATGTGEITDLPVYAESGKTFFPKYNKRRYIRGVKGKIRALIEGDWKLILTPTKSEPILELYNLQTDPTETKNLAKKEPQTAKKMARRLKAWMKKGVRHVVKPANKKQKQILRALGYIQ